MQGKPKVLGLALALVLLTATAAVASSVQQMNLDEMCDRAELVYRANVLSVEEGTVVLPGGELPQVTYTLEVVEGFKNAAAGDVLTLRMVGTLGEGTSVENGNVRFSALPEMPRLEVGQEYLLLTTAASSIGLSSPVGLGQSSFHIVESGGLDLALNTVDNVGLFRGMRLNAPASGAVPYDLLASEIRRNVAGQ